MGCDTIPSVAIIGAGISGLTCARALNESGLRIKVFEKSRGLGGRMATRRTDSGLQFDHGAQYLSVRDSRFQSRLDSWLDHGVMQPWNGHIVSLCDGAIGEEKSSPDRLVAIPGMSSVCKQFARNLEVLTNTRVAPPSQRHGKWLLKDVEDRELGQFDIVIVSAPAPQAALLLREVPELADRAASVKVEGCWAVLAEFPTRLPVDFDGAFVQNSPLSWIARNSSKPGRNAGTETWVLHASATWTQDHMEECEDVVRVDLLSAFEKATGLNSTAPKYSSAHRWRFALPANPLPEGYLFGSQRSIGACGDWCAGPRVEGAMLSGLAVAEKVLDLRRMNPR